MQLSENWSPVGNLYRENKFYLFLIQAAVMVMISTNSNNATFIGMVYVLSLPYTSESDVNSKVSGQAKIYVRGMRQIGRASCRERV